MQYVQDNKCRVVFQDNVYLSDEDISALKQQSVYATTIQQHAVSSMSCANLLVL